MTATSALLLAAALIGAEGGGDDGDRLTAALFQSATPDEKIRLALSAVPEDARIRVSLDAGTIETAEAMRMLPFGPPWLIGIGLRHRPNFDAESGLCELRTTLIDMKPAATLPTPFDERLGPHLPVVMSDVGMTYDYARPPVDGSASCHDNRSRYVHAATAKAANDGFQAADGVEAMLRSRHTLPRFTCRAHRPRLCAGRSAALLALIRNPSSVEVTERGAGSKTILIVGRVEAVGSEQWSVNLERQGQRLISVRLSAVLRTQP